MSLQANDTRNLLDVVDDLRSHGISRYIDLPQIVVCGEQSSGKSSVLEAVSGVKFPSKDNLCTRFATELILRRGPVAPIKIRIVPSALEERTEDDLEKLLSFHVSVSADKLELGEVVESAKNAMGIDETSKVFSSDILRVELSGPDQPHLTLVDLPGLFQAGSRSQSEADSETVKFLVLSYMKSPRSIILAVVSAKNDFNNQPITKYSRQIDPEGTRTLGLITKPDTLDEGSDSERFYVELAQNKDVKFRLGWHVLRNKDYSSRNSSAEDRNKIESQFFSSGIWRSLSSSHVGVHSLKVRLSKILKDHILSQLPDVLLQIKDGIHDCTKRLGELGTSRATPQEQRRYLLHVSQSFNTLVRAAIDGQYSDSFFGDASTADGYQRRVRAVLQNTLTEFAAVMRKKGHTYTIIDEGSATLPGQISRTDYVSKVAKLLERSRGRELPGTFDPLIVAQLFHEQRRPWAMLIERYLNTVLRAVYYLARTALAHVCDQSTLDGLSRFFIYKRLEKLTIELRNKMTELLKPHDTGHPITYNHYLTENVQKAQSRRRTQEIKKSMEKVLGGDFTFDGIVTHSFNVNSLINALVTKTEADMNNYASSTATDFMEAYYKVAMKKVIDDFCVLAVEACLVQELPNLLCPSDVLDIDDATVAALGSESEESATERLLCDKKLKILKDGLRVLQNIQDVSSAMKDPEMRHVPFSEEILHEDPDQEDVIPTVADEYRNGESTPPPSSCPGTLEDAPPLKEVVEEPASVEEPYIEPVPNTVSYYRTTPAPVSAWDIFDSPATVRSSKKKKKKSPSAEPDVVD